MATRRPVPNLTAEQIGLHRDTSDNKIARLVMTTATKPNRERRKLAKAFLRDAQLEGISPRSRTVLALEAVRLCAVGALEDVADSLWNKPFGTDKKWRAICDVFTAYATKMLKTK